MLLTGSIKLPGSTTTCNTSTCGNYYIPETADTYHTFLDGTPAYETKMSLTPRPVAATLPADKMQVAMDVWLIAFALIALLGWWLNKQPQYRTIGTAMLAAGATAFTYRAYTQNQAQNA